MTKPQQQHRSSTIEDDHPSHTNQGARDGGGRFLAVADAYRQRAEVVVEWLRCEATKSYGSRVGGEHGGDKS